MSKAENIVSIVGYKEKKIQESVHTRYMEKLVESIKAVQELESVIYEIENEYGPKVLKKTWKSLSSEDQMQSQYCFDALVRKSSECKGKAIPLPISHYKPSL